MFNNSTVVSGTVNRRHPDVSACRPQAWRVSLSKKTSSSEVQRNLLFYISIMFILYSHCKVFCPIGRALVFVVVICSVIACFSLMWESLDTLSFLFSAAAMTVKKKMCCVEFTEWIK